MVTAAFHFSFPDAPESQRGVALPDESESCADVPVLAGPFTREGEYVVAGIRGGETGVGQVFGADEAADEESHSGTLLQIGVHPVSSQGACIHHCRVPPVS